MPGEINPMYLPLGVSIQYVILDASLALTAFLVGFIGAYYYLRQQAGKLQEQNQRPQSQPDQSSIFEVERADMAVQQLKDLASHVASDVGAHNKFVTGISDRLESIELNDSGAGDKVSVALQEILVANQKLQARLADAEKKIQVQAEELRTQHSEARTDSLTKLANRRAFDDAVEKAMNRFNKEGKPFSLMLFDVDHFKKFNDTYGHQAGDEVLRQVANTLSKTAKTTDLACRYGGEEFGLVMPNTTIAQARIAAERIREAIQATKVNFDGKCLSVTASMGVAEVLRGDDSARLIRRSDEAIYCAKGAGRNCGFWHDGDACLSMNDPGEPKAAYKVATSHKQLPDQTAFALELQRRISEAQRFGNPLTVMYLKVVGFKALEREFGSTLGDMLLDSVGQFVGGTLRDMDLLGRAEPGEFMVMLPGSSERDAAVVGNRIQSALANCAIPLGGTRITLQVSLGITEVEPADDANQFVDRARASIGSAQKVVAVV
jgi:diguanylate cyclase